MTHTLRGDGFDASEDGTGRGTPLVAAPLSTGSSGAGGPRIDLDHGVLVPVVAPTLRAGGNSDTCELLVPVDLQNVAFGGDVAGTLDTSRPSRGGGQAVMQPITLEVRGRADGRRLETRQDGLANALRTSNGGRDGMGVGAVAYALRSDASRDGRALTPSPDAKGRVRLRDPGFNFEVDRAPTLDAVGPHVVAAPVAFVQNSRSEVRLENGDGRVTGAVAAQAGSQQQSYVAVPALADPLTSNEGATYSHAGFSTRPLHNNPPAVAYDVTGAPATVGARPTDVHTALRARAPGGSEASTTTVVAQPAMALRRLTPTECERMQGLPDGWTLIDWIGRPVPQLARIDRRRPKPAADGVRYRAIGNGMAVPVIRYIGERIAAVAAARGETAVRDGVAVRDGAAARGETAAPDTAPPPGASTGSKPERGAVPRKGRVDRRRRGAREVTA